MNKCIYVQLPKAYEERSSGIKMLQTCYFSHRCTCSHPCMIARKWLVAFRFYFRPFLISGKKHKRGPVGSVVVLSDIEF